MVLLLHVLACIMAMSWGCYLCHYQWDSHDICFGLENREYDL